MTPTPSQPVAPQALAERKSRLGLTALLVSVIGFALSCSSQFITAGWVLLAIAFILGLVGVIRPGKAEKSSITAIVISVAGVAVSVFLIIFGVSQFLVEVFWSLLVSIFNDSGRP